MVDRETRFDVAGVVKGIDVDSMWLLFDNAEAKGRHSLPDHI